MSKKIFLSYDYQNDFDRVNQIRQSGIIKDLKPLSFEDWTELCNQGDDAIKKWIDEQIDSCDCVIVLIGNDTVHRKWIRYEIAKAWNDKKGLFGIYIHNLYDHQKGQTIKGENPFENFKMNRDKKSLRNVIKTYDPDPLNTFNCIYDNINDWIDIALDIRDYY